MYNWQIKINKNECLNVKVEVVFNSEFSKEEMQEIQKFYDNQNKKINFKEKVKVNGIYHKNRTKLIASWQSKSKQSENALGFIMFNPSFANPENSDDTIRNAIKFANQEGYNKIVVFNLFPIRISGADFVCKYYKKEFLKEYECVKDFDDLPNDVVLCWGKLPRKIPYIDKIIDNLYSTLKEKQKNLYQITDDTFQRHLSSPSINSIKGISQLRLTEIKSIYKFNN